MHFRNLIRSTMGLSVVVAAPAAAEWREATTEHFVVVSDASERTLIKMSQQLEAVHWLIGFVTGRESSENKQRVRIYLVDGISDVRRAMNVSANSNVAGFYRTSVTGAFAVVPTNQGQFSNTIFFHEYAHHFTLQYLPMALPSWLSEGLAEVFSTASFEREGTISYGRVAVHRGYELYGGERWVPTALMFTPRTSSNPRAGTASYGQYWLTTHYLLSNPARSQQLNEFVRRINSGQSFTEANAAFPTGVEQLDRDIRAYLRNNDFRYRQVPLPADVMRAPTLRIMRPGEVAILPLELQLERLRDGDPENVLGPRIAAAVARFPDDPTVALLQTRYLIQKEDWASAITAAERVLTAEPNNVRALAWRGWAQFAEAEAANRNLTDAEIRQMRAPIIQANRLNTEDPIPLLAYYHSFRLAGQDVPEIAMEGLVRASDLIPQEEGVRMQAIVELIQRDLKTAARQRLAPMAYSPHRSSNQAYALQLLNWLDAGGEGDMPRYVDIPDMPNLEGSD